MERLQRIAESAYFPLLITLLMLPIPDFFFFFVFLIIIVIAFFLLLIFSSKASVLYKILF